MKAESERTEEVITDRVVTLPNALTLLRFLLIPLFLWLLFGTSHHTAALAVFVIAACTDWMDGVAARSLHQVSRIGKLFDPLVDRLLLAAGVVSVCVLGRVPVWIVVVLIARDLVLLAEGAIQLRVMGSVTKVSYIGKFATAFLLTGFSFLLLGIPSVPGLDIVDSVWLPGLGSGPAFLGIFFVYIGFVLSVTVFFVYQFRGAKEYRRFRAQKEHDGADFLA